MTSPSALPDRAVCWDTGQTRSASGHFPKKGMSGLPCSTFAVLELRSHPCEPSAVCRVPPAPAIVVSRAQCASNTGQHCSQQLMPGLSVSAETRCEVVERQHGQRGWWSARLGEQHTHSHTHTHACTHTHTHKAHTHLAHVRARTPACSELPTRTPSCLPPHTSLLQPRDVSLGTCNYPVSQLHFQAS